MQDVFIVFFALGIATLFVLGAVATYLKQRRFNSRREKDCQWQREQAKAEMEVWAQTGGCKGDDDAFRAFVGAVVKHTARYSGDETEIALLQTAEQALLVYSAAHIGTSMDTFKGASLQELRWIAQDSEAAFTGLQLLQHYCVAAAKRKHNDESFGIGRTPPVRGIIKIDNVPGAPANS
ncbi:hypothetical protein DIPPA_21855 [Diplonema papillatum]|nr:hypothetical protein DIPPA_21855 [Diplonema papillatum]